MPFERKEIVKHDGRRLWLYAWEQQTPEVSPETAGFEIESHGLELRWNPLLEAWIVVAPERQDRTFFPPDEHCPLCPTTDVQTPTEIPVADYEIAVFENRFPSFSQHAEVPPRAGKPYKSSRASGSAEVVVYSPHHSASLADMTLPHVERLVDVWVDRYTALAARSDVQYVFIFENRGCEIGVTLTHPHGQIYAFPFVPPVPAQELESAGRYRRMNGTCLHCDVVTAETGAGERVIFANDGFLAFVPYYARYPYEVHITSRAHRGSLLDLTFDERRDLAAALQTTLRKYDSLWSRPMPFVMAMHQKPTGGQPQAESHLHLELTPSYRSRDRLKFLAGSETGAGVFINDARAEETAAELRTATPST